jgi:hypothetical protein
MGGERETLYASSTQKDTSIFGFSVRNVIGNLLCSCEMDERPMADTLGESSSDIEVLDALDK